MIQFSTELPQVLTARNPDNSLSMQRALKQIKELLEVASFDLSWNSQAEVDIWEDKRNASIDDVDTMLDALK